MLEGDFDAQLFYGLSIDELRKYFDANKTVRQTETVELSEIFLSLAGKPEADVKRAPINSSRRFAAALIWHPGHGVLGTQPTETKAKLAV